MQPLMKSRCMSTRCWRPPNERGRCLQAISHAGTDEKRHASGVRSRSRSSRRKRPSSSSTCRIPIRPRRLRRSRRLRYFGARARIANIKKTLDAARERAFWSSISRTAGTLTMSRRRPRFAQLAQVECAENHAQTAGAAGQAARQGHLGLCDRRRIAAEAR